MDKEYLEKWISANYKKLENSEWYEEIGGETYIDADCFIRNYIYPLITNNVMYDFDNIQLDVDALFNQK